MAKRSSGAEAAEAFLAALDHPYKAEILALRAIVLAADPRIAEGVKWNAPSFHTTEHFATFQLRAREGAQLILHLGAKPRAADAPPLTIADPDSLLTWLGADRASALFRGVESVEARRDSFTAIIRQWIAYVPARGDAGQSEERP